VRIEHKGDDHSPTVLALTGIQKAGHRPPGRRAADLAPGLDAYPRPPTRPKLLREDVHFVADNGTSSFVPVSQYLIENDAAGITTDTKWRWRRLVCAQGWYGGCARNQKDTSRLAVERRVDHSAS
jgi:hypothetical protein